MTLNNHQQRAISQINALSKSESPIPEMALGESAHQRDARHFLERAARETVD